MDLKPYREGLDLIQQGMRKLNGGPMDWYLRKLGECHDLLLSKYAPFHVGGRVFLTETPRIEADSGWARSAHFLVRGAVGTIREVDVDGRGFSAAVEFDDESWVCDFGADKGKVMPIEPECRHTYHFHERMLARLPSTVGAVLPKGKEHG